MGMGVPALQSRRGGSSIDSNGLVGMGVEVYTPCDTSSSLEVGFGDNYSRVDNIGLGATTSRIDTSREVP